MSNKYVSKYVSKFFEITGKLNPYRNSDGHIEYSRFVALIMVEVIAALLWSLKLLNEPLEAEKPYNLVAYFYHYTLVWPLEQLSAVAAWLKALPTTGYAKVDLSIFAAGMGGYVFLVMSAYLVVYAVFLHLRKRRFAIGDFLGFWCAPLFLGMLWYFGGLGIDWVVALKASLR